MVTGRLWHSRRTAVAVIQLSNDPINATRRPEPLDVVFDFDGVLADSARLIVEVLRPLVGSVTGVDLSEHDLRGVVGPPLETALVQIMAGTAHPLEQDQANAIATAFRTAYALRAPRETTPFPGMQSMLAELDAVGLRCSICSSKPREILNAILAAWPGRWPFVAIEAPPLGVTEPKALGLSRLLAHLETPASRAVLVGDTHHDAQAARTVGTAFVAVEWGVGNPAELSRWDPVGMASTPDDLTRILNAWRAGA